MLAPGDSHLCEKKDVILSKFDQLLRKLGGEELSLNISLGKMGEEWHAAMEGWLDAESTYRLRIEQVLRASLGHPAMPPFVYALAICKYLPIKEVGGPGEGEGLGGKS